MKTFIIIILFILCAGVFGAEVKSVSVMEGDSVTLRTDLTEIKTGDLVWWRFKKGDSKDLLAEIGKNKIWYGERFKDKLLTDGKTGDLNITNIKIKYSGLYEAEINSGTGTSYKRFNVTVNESPRVNNAGMSDVKSVSVTERESVTLQTDVKLQTDDLILWRFGDESVLIAKGDMEDNKTSVYDGADGSFGDRLKMNDQTGDLTITDCKPEHSGLYQLKIISNKQTLYKTFSVIVRGAGSSLGVIAVLCVIFLLVIAAIIAAGLILYRHKISKLLVPVDEQKSVVPRSEMEAEMRDDEFKDVTDTVDENTQKPQNSVTYTVDKNTQKQQDSVCAADINEEMIITGKLGESVTLDTCVAEIQRDDEILWMFGDMTIAEYTGGTNKLTLNNTDERFKDRLEINHQTGDLTIKSIRPELTGVYKVQIKNSSGNKERKFIVALYVQAMMGGSVPLPTKVKIQEGDMVKWTSEDKTSLVTGMNGDDSKTSYTDDQRFRDRLKMYAQTGNLFIRDIRQTDEGVYTLKLINTDGKITYRIFNVEVTDLNRQQTRIEEPTGWRKKATVLKEVNPRSYLVETEDGQTLRRNRQSLLKTPEKCPLVDEPTELQSCEMPLVDLQRHEMLSPAEAQQNLQKPQKSDGQKSLVPRSEREAERRAKEFKEVRDKFDENNQKWQNSDVAVKGEVKLISVKGDQAANTSQILQIQQHSGTDKVDENIQNPQNSVCAADINEEMIRTGKMGLSVTLDTCVTEIQRDDEIVWMFEDMTIAEYTGGSNKPTLNKTDERFKDNLEMNHQTGDLTIKNMRTENTGEYKVKIKRRSGTKERKFIVALIHVQAMMGGSVPLPTKVQIQQGDAVKWTSKDKTSLVTGMNGDYSKTSYTDDERFRERLKMKPETGDLLILNLRETDEGVYTLKLNNTDGRITYRIFNVEVTGLENIQKEQNSVRGRTGKLEESVPLYTKTQRDDKIGETTLMLGDAGNSADGSDESVEKETKPLLETADRSKVSTRLTDHMVTMI